EERKGRRGGTEVRPETGGEHRPGDGRCRHRALKEALEGGTKVPRRDRRSGRGRDRRGRLRVLHGHRLVRRVLKQPGWSADAYTPGRSGSSIAAAPPKQQAHAGVPAASGLPRHRDHRVARGRASISSQGRLPSSATIYIIAVVEELGVQALPLRHVLWTGGPPGTGKTAVATRIARRHGLRWYGADTRTWQHRDRALRAGNPAARRWETMTPQERWVQSTPTQMLEMSLHAERGPMVLDDLRALPESPLVVAEGSTLPAQAVSGGLADRSRAVWLLPTPDFQRALLAARGTPPGPTALYLLLRDRIAREANEHGAPPLLLAGPRGV